MAAWAGFSEEELQRMKHNGEVGEYKCYIFTQKRFHSCSLPVNEMKYTHNDAGCYCVSY